MGVFSVFNIGSGHTASEPNQTIGVLGKECSIGYGNLHKIMTDGVLAVAGAYAGDFTERINANFDAIVEGAQPMYTRYPKGGLTQNFCSAKLQPGDTVNLTGHSRGAVMCHLLANRLADAMAPRGNITINMIVLDPVNMTKRYSKESGQLNANACRMLGEYRVIAMTNETSSSTFPLKMIQLDDPNHIGKLKLLTLPGTHGTATKCLTTKVGKACLEMIRFYMTDWGTQFINPVISDLNFCELFADVHLEMLNVSHRQKVMVEGKDVKFSKDRAKAIQQNWTDNTEWQNERARMGKRAFGQYFPHSYFINRFHENRFRKHYHVDSIYELFRRKVQISQKMRDSVKRYLDWCEQ